MESNNYKAIGIDEVPVGGGAIDHHTTAHPDLQSERAGLLELSSMLGRLFMYGQKTKIRYMRLQLSGLLLCFCMIGIAQTNYKPGYIINNSGDSIPGLIEINSQKTNSRLCVYKADKKSQPMQYTANDILAYRVLDGRYYVSRTIWSGNVQRKVFLEYLVNGIADLYYSKDFYGDHFYIQNANDSLIELKNTSSEIYVNGVTYKRDNNEYAQMLGLTFKDCPEVFQDIGETRFNHKDLIETTQNYHKFTCTEYECITYEKNLKYRYSLGITAGFVSSILDFDARDYDYRHFDSLSFSFSDGYSFGALFSVDNIFGISDRFTFNTQLAFKKNKYSSPQLIIEQKSLYIPVYLTYYFLTGDLKPLINFGVGNKIFLATDFTHYSSYRYHIKQFIGNYEITGFFGGGVEYRKNNMSYLIIANCELGSGLIEGGFYTLNYLTSNSIEFNVNAGMKYHF